MYAKLLIKFYVVIFGINLALGGVMMQQNWMLVLSLINIVALFVILFQHSNLFIDYVPQERVLFTSDVFAFLAIWCGIAGGAVLYSSYSAIVPELWQMMLLVGGFFYIATVWLFRMVDKTNYRAQWSMNLLAGVLIVAFVMVEGSRLYSTHGDTLNDYSTAITNWSQTQLDQLDRLATREAQEIPPMDDLPTPADERAPDSDEEQPPTDQPSSTETEQDRLFAIDEQTADEVLTYGSFLPTLQERYDLSAGRSTPSFTYVALSNELYQPYAAAYNERMIGTTTNPATQIRCGNLMVLLGLAENWDVTYTSANVIDQFWQEAETRGYTDAGCSDPDQLATWADLP